MTVQRESVKFIHAALDEDNEKNIILRGVISPESFDLLQTDDYQREALPKSSLTDLRRAFEAGESIPDVYLGMRGGSFIEKDGAFYLQNPIFIVDGLQRTTAAKLVLKDGKHARLGATVHFNTDKAWERDTFRKLNTLRAKLSTNILLRNSAPDYAVMEMLFNLTKDSSFVLAGKICWEQRMKRDELISAVTFVRSIGNLHAKFATGLSSYSVLPMVGGLEKAYNKIGRNTIRNNVKTFWEMMDDCFKIRLITFKEGSPVIKAGFLDVMAQVLSDHSNFWHDSKLFIDAPMKRKIASFPISDPEFARLAGAGGSAVEILVYHVVKHINSGKKKYKLNPIRKSIKQTVKEEEVVA